MARALPVDLSLPHDAQHLGASHLPALGQLSLLSQLGAVMRIIPRITMPARHAADRKLKRFL